VHSAAHTHMLPCFEHVPSILIGTCICMYECRGFCQYVFYAHAHAYLHIHIYAHMVSGILVLHKTIKVGATLHVPPLAMAPHAHHAPTDSKIHNNEVVHTHTHFV
jgi:hypothetical protein